MTMTYAMAELLHAASGPLFDEQAHRQEQDAARRRIAELDALIDAAERGSKRRQELRDERSGLRLSLGN